MATGEDPSPDVIRAMSGSLRHRGPDDEGHYCDADRGGHTALGHRRLAIIDLTATGRQPMTSSTGRYVIVYNGEIYNYRLLAGELARSRTGFRPRGASDTEVLLEAVEQWGLDAAVKKFVGIFAFALWDRRERVLRLVRDHLGVKPLYYGRAGNSFVFASELKAIAAHPEFEPTINRGAIALLLRHNCIPAPHSIYKDAWKLPPGMILSIPQGSEREIANPRPFWSARQVAEEGVRHPVELTDREAVDALDALLRDAIGLQMIADVPLGAFLSGGIDSTTVVALMQTQSTRPVRTFSIGFSAPGYDDEAPHARAVAQHLGTDHTELYVSPADALAVIPRLPDLYDEPFADSSQIPTFIVSQLARRHVTVTLSGDGGDELFGGYNRHVLGPALWDRLSRIPPIARRAARRAITSLSPAFIANAIASTRLLPGRFSEKRIGYNLHKFADLLTVDSAEGMYLDLVSHWKAPASVVCGVDEPATKVTEARSWPRLPDFAQEMMFLDLTTYLPDDVLTKVDRASMAVSLEARVPLLDHRVVEFAWRLPFRQKIRHGRGKWALRALLERYIPTQLVERPKTGFGIPIDVWLRGPLRDWAEALLDPARLRDEGFFAVAPIREKWQEHLSGRRDWQYQLWDVLMFQAWYATSLRRAD